MERVVKNGVECFKTLLLGEVVYLPIPAKNSQSAQYLEDTLIELEDPRENYESLPYPY
jgi:hypothetical protein